MGKKAKLKEAADSPSPFKVRLVIWLENLFDITQQTIFQGVKKK